MTVMSIALQTADQAKFVS